MLTDKKYSSYRVTSGTYEGLIFDQCQFEACYLGAEEGSAFAPVVRDVGLRNCSLIRCHVGRTILERVHIKSDRTTFSANGLLVFTNCIFRECVLEGQLGEIQIRSDADQRNMDLAPKHSFALDITRAEFASCDISGVAAESILLDPETQIRITRSAIEAYADVKSLPPIVHVMVQHFLARKHEQAILVAPKRHPRFQEIRRGLTVLKRQVQYNGL